MSTPTVSDDVNCVIYVVLVAGVPTGSPEDVIFTEERKWNYSATSLILLPVYWIHSIPGVLKCARIAYHRPTKSNAT